MEKVARLLQRREPEPVIYPDGFDKFTGGDLQRILEPRGIKTLIITGSATNVAVLYTATAAARIHRYEVIVPVDGVNARTQYAHDYSLYQLSVLPGGVCKCIRFTTLGATSLFERSVVAVTCYYSAPFDTAQDERSMKTPFMVSPSISLRTGCQNQNGDSISFIENENFIKGGSIMRELKIIYRSESHAPFWVLAEQAGIWEKTDSMSIPAHSLTVKGPLTR